MAFPVLCGGCDYSGTCDDVGQTNLLCCDGMVCCPFCGWRSILFGHRFGQTGALVSTVQVQVLVPLRTKCIVGGARLPGDLYGYPFGETLKFSSHFSFIKVFVGFYSWGHLLSFLDRLLRLNPNFASQLSQLADTPMVAMAGYSERMVW